MAAKDEAEESKPLKETQKLLGGGRSEFHDSGILQNVINSDKTAGEDPASNESYPCNPPFAPRHFYVHSPALSATSSLTAPYPIEEQEGYEQTATSFCGSQVCAEERVRMRRENAILLQEKNELMRRIDAMERTLVCSQIVEGHTHLVEKCRELQEELDYFKCISENATKADEIKSEKVQIMQKRLEQLQSNLTNKEAYIKQLREQLAELFQKLRVEESGTQHLREAMAKLERKLSDAKDENQFHLEELLGYLAQISELKKTMSDLKEELNQEKDLRKDVLLRRSYKKDKPRPLSVPVFCDES